MNWLVWCGEQTLQGYNNFVNISVTWYKYAELYTHIDNSYFVQKLLLNYSGSVLYHHSSCVSSTRYGHVRVVHEILTRACRPRDIDTCVSSTRY